MLKVKTDHLKQKHVSLHHKLARDPASPLPLNCLVAAVGLLVVLSLSRPLLLSHQKAFLEGAPHSLASSTVVCTPCLGCCPVLQSLSLWALGNGSTGTDPLGFGKWKKGISASRWTVGTTVMNGQRDMSASGPSCRLTRSAAWAMAAAEHPCSRVRAEGKAPSFSAGKWVVAS